VRHAGGQTSPWGVWGHAIPRTAALRERQR
jgi:hypothetical protein